MSTDTLHAEHAPPSIDQRLAKLEAFDAEVSGVIDKLVDAVLEARNQPAATEVETLKAKLREIEQQLSVERATRDLTRVSCMHPKRRAVVFVGTTYFGDNVKYAWAALHQRAPALGIEVWFLPFNADQQALLESLGANCLPAAYAQWTPEQLHAVLSAAVVVTSDHFLNPNPFAPALLAGARQVQLWHGVSIKEIGLRNLAPGRALGPHFARVLATCGTYARFIGTAAAGEEEWRRWFAFERYAPTGYPRNDVLYREPGPLDLANVDRETYERACATVAAGRRVILYAPTFRDGRPDWMLHAGLDRLGDELGARGDLLVVNLHPVEQPQVPQLAPRFPKLAFVAPRTDAYPLLARASALVTDYSSVMFDYLHLDRPVLLYRPDHQSYTSKSRKLFDDKLARLPGPVFENPTVLARALRRGDLAQSPEHAEIRHQLLAQWFDHHDGLSGERFVQEIEAELALAGCGLGAEG